MFTYLNEGEHRPAIVLLSACNTGQAGAVQNLLQLDVAGLLGGAGQNAGAPDGDASDLGDGGMRGAHETAPMAAGLVALGIPVVIGMAGRVADSACRHFTRRFGEALVRGEPLVKATAEGRRAAFAYDDQSPENSVDWAFPAVFLSPAVPSHYAPTPPAGATTDVENWVSIYNEKKDAEPAFCGRHEFFDAYYDLFDPARPAVLGAYVAAPTPPSAASMKSNDSGSDRQYGKSRLLRELTKLAIRDGHIPVVVSANSATEDEPMSVRELLAALFKALNKTRETYGLAPTAWQVSALIKIANGTPAPLLPSVEEAFIGDLETIKGNTIREALACDMTYLLRGAHDQHQFVRDARGTAILFLDNVHKYPLEFVETWFDGTVLGGGGLRRATAVRRDGTWDPAGTILPVVMTFSTGGAPGIILKSVTERDKTLGWIRLERLWPFSSTDDVDLIAYQNVLLHPFDQKGVMRPNISNRPFTLNYKSDRGHWTHWVQELRVDFCGLPDYLGTPAYYRMVSYMERDKVVVSADDERRLTEYMK
jgi:hypothetical protein